MNVQDIRRFAQGEIVNLADDFARRLSAVIKKIESEFAEVGGSYVDAAASRGEDLQDVQDELNSGKEEVVQEIADSLEDFGEQCRDIFGLEPCSDAVDMLVSEFNEFKNYGQDGD